MNSPPVQTNQETISDAELIARFAQHDEQALNELYQRYSDIAYGLAKRICNSKETAEEVVLDSFMKLWNRPKLFDPKQASFATYFLALVRNAAIDAIRRQRMTIPLHNEEGVLLDISTDDPSPLDKAELANLGHKVQQAMQKLSENHRKTIELAYFGTASREEIAKQMDVPVGTVKSRLKYALDKLRSLLEDL